MRPRTITGFLAIALLISACGIDTSASEGQASGGSSAGSSSAASASPGAAGLVVLHGTFTGHFSDALATADQTVAFELHWNAGPDDIHDSNAFILASGTFTFSESIGGVCGGARTEEGPLTSFVNQQSLFAADPQDRDNAQMLVIDHRLSGGGVEFSVSSLFEVPHSDPEGCGDFDRSGVGSCPLVFLQTAIGELQQDADCSGASGEWTGHLQP